MDDSVLIHGKYPPYGGHDFGHYELGGYAYRDIISGDGSFYYHLYGLCAIFINLLRYIVFSFKDQRPQKINVVHPLIPLYLDLH